jgi:hypothetical protein
MGDVQAVAGPWGVLSFLFVFPALEIIPQHPASVIYLPRLVAAATSGAGAPHGQLQAVVKPWPMENA